VNQGLWTAIMGGAGMGSAGGQPESEQAGEELRAECLWMHEDHMLQAHAHLSNGNMRNQRVTLHWGHRLLKFRGARAMQCVILHWGACFAPRMPATDR
jgi:hypothetical protein